MRLHHQPRSRSTRVLWLLEELGIPFDLTVMSREMKQTPEYKALHPLGRSPVLEEDGGPVFESAALILHIADQNLDAGLIAPLGSHERALQYQWCFFGMTDSEGALMDIARQLWGSGEADQGIIERAAARFVATAEVVEAALGDDDYLVGNSFSVADIVVGSVLGFARTGEITELPVGVVPYVDRLEARPARQRAVAVAAAGVGRMKLRPRRDQGDGTQPPCDLPAQQGAAARARCGHAGAPPDDDRASFRSAADDSAHLLRVRIGSRDRGIERRRGPAARLVAEPVRRPARDDHVAARGRRRWQPGRRPTTSTRASGPPSLRRTPATPPMRAGRRARSRSCCCRREVSGTKKMHRVGSSFVQLPDQPSLALQSLGRPSTSGAPCSVQEGT